MTRPIRQSVTLAAPAAALYRMYLNAKTHAAITGGKVVVSARRGSTFSAFGGLLRGRTLHTVPGRLIVSAKLNGVAARIVYSLRDAIVKLGRSPLPNRTDDG